MSQSPHRTVSGKHTAVFSQLYADDPKLKQLDLAGALCASPSSSPSSSRRNQQQTQQSDQDRGGDTSLSTISDALHCSTHLQELNLSNNGITNVGASLLADALSNENAAKGLTSVILDGNAVGTEGVLAIVGALRQSPKTIYISLENNLAHVDESAMFQLRTMVQLNDQPGKLRQIILDLIAEHAHYDDQQQQQNGSSNNNKNNNALKMTCRTRTVNLDLSSAYARFPPPKKSVNDAISSFQQQQQQSNDEEDGDNNNNNSPASAEERHLQRLTLADLFQQFLQILCDTIQYNRILLKLNLSCNFITDDGAKSIAKMLRENRHLDEIYLDTNSITDEGAIHLVKSFEQNNTLCILSLLRNNVSPDVMFRLETAQALNREPLFLKRWYDELFENSESCPTSLVFDNKGSQRKYSDVGIRMMCVALERNTRVTHLKIVEAAITDIGCQCIRDLMRKNKVITKLELDQCTEMGFDGVSRLCDMLSVNETIESLGVPRCNIDDPTALRIAAAVERHPSLTELDVSYNPNIVSSASAIAAVFAHNFRLKNVNVDGTSCTESVKTAVRMRQMASNQPERLRSLFGHLISNHWELTSVELRPSSLDDVKLDDQAIEMLSQALVDNTKVTNLDISGNNFTLLGAKEVYRMLRLNRSTLRTLNMSDNPAIGFGYQHAKLVAAVLGLHTVLHSVDISNTGMDDAGVDFIFGEVETFNKRTHVRKIDVSRNKLVSEDVASRLQLILRAHALHPVVKRRFRDVHREWKLATHRTPFRTLKLSHVFDHAADYFDVPPPSEEDRVQCVAICVDFLRDHAYHNVTVLDVAGNHCGDEGIRLIAQYVRWASTKKKVPIESINASENSMSDDGIEYLCRAAVDCASIRSINAGGNGDALGGSVTEAALTELQARVSFNLQPEEMRNLIKNAEEGTIGARGGGGDAGGGGNGMSSTGDIDESTRAQHHVNDTHVGLLVRALKRKGAAEIHSVNFSNNYITLAGLNDLISLAAQRGCLKKIFLRNTMIRGMTEEEAQMLVDNLLKTELTHVDLSDNEFKDEFAEKLLPVLRKSKSLVFFSMNASGLDPSIELAVASSVSLNALSNDIASSGLAGQLQQQQQPDDDENYHSSSRGSQRRKSSAASVRKSSRSHHQRQQSGDVSVDDHHHHDHENNDSRSASAKRKAPSNIGTISSPNNNNNNSISTTDHHKHSHQRKQSATTTSMRRRKSSTGSRMMMTDDDGENYENEPDSAGRRVSEMFATEKLNLAKSHLDERQLAEIVRMSRSSDVTTEIDLSYNKLPDESLSQIVLLLVGSQSLERLNLAGNVVGNQTLQTLTHLVSGKSTSATTNEDNNNNNNNNNSPCYIKHLNLSNAMSCRISGEILSEFFAASYHESETLWDVVIDNVNIDERKNHNEHNKNSTNDGNNNGSSSGRNKNNSKSKNSATATSSAAALVPFADDLYQLTEQQHEELLRLRLNRQLRLKRVLPRIRRNDPTLSEVIVTGPRSLEDDQKAAMKSRFGASNGSGDGTNNTSSSDPLAPGEELSYLHYEEEHNIVDDTGLKILADAMMSNTHVWKVELKISEVSDVGVRYLEPVLASGSAISHLSLQGSTILRDGRSFADLIKVSKGLTTFNIHDNTLLDPSSLREIGAAIVLRRRIRHCDVSECGSKKMQELRSKLEKAKQNYTSNHMDFALEHGDVDLFRDDDTIKQLEADLQTTAIELRRYELDLEDAVEKVKQALFFNGHALLLASFVDQESQEQIMMAKQARMARRSAIIDRQKRAIRRSKAKSSRLLGDTVDEDDELTEEELKKRKKESLYEAIKKQQAQHFSPVQARIRYDAALDVYDDEQQLEKLQAFKKDLENDEDIKDPNISEEERYYRIKRNEQRARDRQHRDQKNRLRQFVYTEFGEPVPGKFFSEPPVITRLDLSRPELFSGMLGASGGVDAAMTQHQDIYLVNDESANNLIQQRSLGTMTSSSSNISNHQLEDYFIDDEAVKILCKHLKSNDTVVYLSLANQNLSALSSIFLSDMLKENYALEKIDLQGNELMDSIGQLCDSLNTNHKVTEINCSDNGTTDVLLHRIDVLCKTNEEPLKFKDILLTIFEHRAEPRAINLCYLEEELFGNKKKDTTTTAKDEEISYSGGAASSLLLMRNRHQQNNNNNNKNNDANSSAAAGAGGRNQADEQVLDSMRQQFSVNTGSVATPEQLLTSTELYPLKKLRIDDTSSKLLCENGLQRCVSVRFIDISNSNVGDEGVNAFINVFADTRTIVTFHMKNIKITDIAGENVASAWKTIPTLQAIDLSNNPRISDVTVDKAIASAKSTFKCTQFVVEGCEFVTNQLAERLELLCKVNTLFQKSEERVTLVDCIMNEPSRTVANLDSLCSRKLMTPEALEVICHCIPMSNFVKEFTLEHNDLEDSSLPSIISCLLKCPKLECLSLGANLFVDVTDLCLALAPWMNDDDENGNSYNNSRTTDDFLGESSSAKKRRKSSHHHHKKHRHHHSSNNNNEESGFVAFSEQDDDVNPSLAAVDSSVSFLQQQQQQQSGNFDQTITATNNEDETGERRHPSVEGVDDETLAFVPARLKRRGVSNVTMSTSSPAVSPTPPNQQQQSTMRDENTSSTSPPQLQSLEVSQTFNSSTKSTNNNNNNLAGSSFLLESTVNSTSSSSLRKRIYPCRFLTKLLLHRNKLSVAAAFSVADMLRSSDQLSELDLRDNPWGRLGARVIVSSLMVNGGLKQIALEAEGVPQSLVKQADSALLVNLKDPRHSHEKNREAIMGLGTTAF